MTLQSACISLKAEPVRPTSPICSELFINLQNTLGRFLTYFGDSIIGGGQVGGIPVVATREWDGTVIASYPITADSLRDTYLTGLQCIGNTPNFAKEDKADSSSIWQGLKTLHKHFPGCQLQVVVDGVLNRDEVGALFSARSKMENELGARVLFFFDNYTTRQIGLELMSEAL